MKANDVVNNDKEKTALLFGGQGDRTLLTSLRRAMDEGSPLLQKACGCPPEQLLKDGGKLLLNTQLLQPVHVALSLMDAIRLERSGIKADYVAGHSLGELTAWAYAGGVTHEEAIDCAAVRGQAMGEVASTLEGGMVAFTDMDETSLHHVLDAGRSVGALDPALFNAPREVVLTGTLSAIRAVMPLGKSRRLQVEGPWHSPLMNKAKVAVSRYLESVPTNSLHIPIVSGLDGACVTESDEMKTRLMAQLEKPVRWGAVVKTLVNLGVTRFVVAGPGHVLRFLVRQNLEGSKVEVV